VNVVLSLEKVTARNSLAFGETIRSDFLAGQGPAGGGKKTNGLFQEPGKRADGHSLGTVGVSDDCLPWGQRAFPAIEKTSFVLWE
jgi:hypothetical protein